VNISATRQFRSRQEMEGRADYQWPNERNLGEKVSEGGE